MQLKVVVSLNSSLFADSVTMADTEDLVKRYRKQNDVEGEEGGGESSYTFKEGVLIEVKNHELDNPYDYESVARLLISVLRFK